MVGQEGFEPPTWRSPIDPRYHCAIGPPNELVKILSDPTNLVKSTNKRQLATLYSFYIMC